MNTLLLLCIALLSEVEGSNPAECDDAQCMVWAIHRITGGNPPASIANETALDEISSEGGADSGSRHRGPTRAGKRGPVGPRGPEGPPGPQGVCDCIPEELTTLQEEHANLKEQVERMRKTSPETLCLLGMENGAIPDSAITVSSNSDVRTNGRLDGTVNGWYPPTNNPGQDWIMANLGKVRIVSGVVTQGRYDYNSWVTKFKVEHSADGNTFTDVKNSDGSEMVFNGNSDRHTKVVNRFPEVVKARFVRIYPMAYEHRIMIRFDIIDC